MNERVITIPLDRYAQLIRAEQDANHLKMLLAEKYESYRDFSREEMKMLVTMFIGNKEDKNV